MLWIFSPLIVFEYSSVLDTCLTVVTEYLMKAAHRRELCLGLHFQGRQPIVAAEMSGQVQEVPDHMTTTVRKQRAMNAGTQLPFVILFCPETQSMQQDRPCTGWVFVPQLNQCGKSLTDIPRDFFHQLAFKNKSKSKSKSQPVY